MRVCSDARVCYERQEKTTKITPDEYPGVCQCAWPKDIPPHVPPCSWLCLWGIPLHHRSPRFKAQAYTLYMILYKTLSVMCSVLKAKPLSKVIVLTCTVHFTNARATPLLSGEFWFFSCNKSCMASATPKGLNDLTPGLTVWVSKQLMLIQPFSPPDRVSGRRHFYI